MHTVEAEQDKWAERRLEQLSLSEKVAQMFSIWASGYFQSTTDPSAQHIADLVERLGVGGVIFGQGDPLAQAAFANDLQRRAMLPLLVSQDMEWGAGMRLPRTTTFPRAMALGATRDPSLAYAAGRATGREARALGVQQVFAPVADVNNNPANPVINVRSFGERPELVAEMATAFARGVQEAGALATAKHFPGHGDTATDSHLGLPVLRIGRTRLDTLELVPFRAAIDAGIGSIMTGHLALPRLEPDSASTVPASLSPRVTQQLLREELGFDGLIVTDALTMRGITEDYGVGEAAIRAVEAGADVVLKSEDVHAAHGAVLRAVRKGRLTEARIDRSVRRILQAKERLGLHRNRLVDLATVREQVGTRAHERLSDAIARQSLTMPRNAGRLLPLTPPAAGADSLTVHSRVLVVTVSDEREASVGRAFRRGLRRSTSVDTLVFRMFDARSDSADAAALQEAAGTFDAVVVPAFLPVRTGSGRIRLPAAQRAFLNQLIQGPSPVALLSFGNPYMPAGLEEQPAAYVAAYGTGAASQEAAAQAVFGRSPFAGRLPVTIPDAYDYGRGRRLPQVAPRRAVPEAAGLSSERLARADSLLRASIGERAFPGAALAVGRGQLLARLEGYGYHTYAMNEAVTPASRFDLASLTKVVATTTAAMQLYEAGRLALDDRVAAYLPAFAQHGKEDVTIQQLLAHAAGLKPYLGSDARGQTRRDLVEAVMGQELQYEPGTQSEYSGLGMITLQLVIEEITGQSLASYAEEHIFAPLGMDRTGFRSASASDSSFVPTASRGGEVFYGRVHDPIARHMGGTSGNAGLFSTAEDLATFAYMLANEGRIYGRQFLDEETIETFTERVGGLDGTRALGWDTKTMDGYSSAGSHFGPNSFGHTGFTGTSLWIDPDQDLFVVLLANRVYPKGGSNEKIEAVRPKLHDRVYEAIMGVPQPVPAINRQQAAIRQAEQ